MNHSRILIVSYSYRPDPSPRAFRWSAIAEYWAARRHDVDVVCAGHGDQPSQQWCDGVRVHRVGGGLWGRWRRRLAGGNGRWREPARGPGQDPTAVAGPSCRLAATACGLLTWAYDHTWKKIRWPDYAAMWYFPAVRRARALIGQQGCDAVVTSSHPFTGHLVGLAIKRAFPGLPWVVDVGDPFCFSTETPSNNDALYGRLNVHMERKVFETASAIAVTNQATQRIYARLFPAAAERIHVIPPLVRTVPPTAAQARVFPHDDRIRLVFFGRLYAGIRSPQRLLATFRRLLETPLGERLELHFFGWTAGCEECFESYRPLLGKSLFRHGPVDHATARQAMAEADFLVNLGNTTSYQLPSKLVEYSQSGRPILNFANSAEDSSALLLETHPAALSLFPAKGEVDHRQWIRLLKFLTQPPAPQPHHLQQWLKPFQPESVAESYEALIETAKLGAKSSCAVVAHHIAPARKRAWHG